MPSVSQAQQKLFAMAEHNPQSALSEEQGTGRSTAQNAP